MKKAYAVLGCCLILCAALFPFVGCGGEDSEEAATTTTTTTTLPKTAVVETKVTVKADGVLAATTVTVKSAGLQAVVIIPEGTVAKTESGALAAAGDLKITVKGSDGTVASTFANGSFDRVVNGVTETFTSFGNVNLDIKDSAGNKIATLSNDFEVDMTIKAGQINPATGKAFVDGDEIPVVGWAADGTVLDLLTGKLVKTESGDFKVQFKIKAGSIVPNGLAIGWWKKHPTV